MTTTPKELLRQAREALAFYADDSRYHGPNVFLEAPDKWSMRAGLTSYRLDVTRDRGVIASKAIAAIDAHLKQPSAPSGEPAEFIGRVIVGHARHRGGWCVFEETAPDEFVLIKGPFATRQEADAAMRDDTPQAAPAPQTSAPSGEMAALLVRDIANDLDIEALTVCKALEAMGYGPHSVNMAITAGMARALTQHFATAQAAPAPSRHYVADMEDTLRQIADAFALPHGNPDLLIAAAKATTRAASAQPAPTQAEHAPTVQPLSEDDLWRIANGLQQQPWGIDSRWTDVVAFVRAIERAHGITATTAKG